MPAASLVEYPRWQTTYTISWIQDAATTGIVPCPFIASGLQHPRIRRLFDQTLSDCVKNVQHQTQIVRTDLQNTFHVIVEEKLESNDQKKEDQPRSQSYVQVSNSPFLGQQFLHDVLPVGFGRGRSIRGRHIVVVVLGGIGRLAGLGGCRETGQDEIRGVTDKGSRNPGAGTRKRGDCQSRSSDPDLDGECSLPQLRVDESRDGLGDNVKGQEFGDCKGEFPRCRWAKTGPEREIILEGKGLEVQLTILVFSACLSRTIRCSFGLGLFAEKVLHHPDPFLGLYESHASHAKELEGCRGRTGYDGGNGCRQQQHDLVAPTGTAAVASHEIVLGEGSPEEFRGSEPE
mmetsp:Transcript_955/g.2433  ORF Transcript_955/g.2433 Transcript_955/m.2433 type:complete len:345 (+) Transcript_955:471-1505(+)